jgi:hypothetical protein
VRQAADHAAGAVVQQVRMTQQQPGRETIRAPSGRPGIRADMSNIDDLDRVYVAVNDRCEGLDIVMTMSRNADQMTS